MAGVKPLQYAFLAFTLFLFCSITVVIAQQSPTSWEERYSLQENSNLTEGTGIKAHWNLTELISSTANAFDSTLADVDGDGTLEIIVSRNAQCEFYCLKQDNSILWKTSLLSPHTPGYYGGRVVDIDNDGRLEFITTADSIWVLDAATGEEKWSVPDVGTYPEEAPWTLGHVNSVDRWNIIIARSFSDTFRVSVYDWEGNLVWCTAIDDAIYGHTLSTEDVDGDGYDEVFVACSKRTVAIDNNGQIMWSAPLTPETIELTAEFMQLHDLIAPDQNSVERWWYHSDFAEVSDLYGDGNYYVLHDYGGGVLDPTTIQILDALSGKVVDSFTSSGHHQWLRTAELRSDFPGAEIAYVTRDKVVLRNSKLEVIWERQLSGAHQLGIGDWNGDGHPDIIVSTIFRGVKRYASIDSNFVVYSPEGNAIYNMLYHYPQSNGKYTGAQMQNALEMVDDADGDGYVDVAVSFSNHDMGKFSSSQDVHQYIMSFTDRGYYNEFHRWGNTSTSVLTDTLLTDDLLLSYLPPTVEYSNPGEHVVLLLHMNEGEGNVVNDSSDYNNDGVLFHGRWTESGKFEKGIYFDGVDSVLSIPNSESLGLNQLSADLWVNITPTRTTQTIFERPGSFGLQITDDYRLLFWLRDTTAQQWSIIQIDAPFTDFGHFVHLAATYDGTFLRLLVNGKEVASDSHQGIIDSGIEGTWGLYIGDGRARETPLQGIIDELRISKSVQPSPHAFSGVWISRKIFKPGTCYGDLIFDHSLNGGSIFYDVLDQDGNLLPDHSHIVQSPHSLSGIVTEPIRIRISLSKGEDDLVSPAIHSIRIKQRFCKYLPTIRLEH